MTTMPAFVLTVLATPFWIVSSDELETHRTIVSFLDVSRGSVQSKDRTENEPLMCDI